jgi:hypothetical protein
MSVPNRFRSIVGGASLAAGAVGVPGAFAFGADVPVLIGIWASGAALIVDEAGGSFSKEDLVPLATATVTGTATFIAGSKLAAKLFHLVPGPGTLAAIGVNSFLDAFFTYRFLRAVAKVYDQRDPEEITYQMLMNCISLFSAWTFLDDIKDMKECMEAGVQMKEAFA